MDLTLFAHGEFFFSSPTGLVCVVLSLFGLLASGGVTWSAARASRGLFTAVRARLGPRLSSWRATRRLGELPARSAAAELAEGDVVRVEGVVLAQGARPARLSGIPSVACRYAVGERGGGTIDAGGFAQDFVLALADGTEVRVMAGHAAELRKLLLVDGSPQRWTEERLPDGWFSESRVAPADAAAVVGRLVRQIDPSAERAGDRQPGLRWTIEPDRAGLLVYTRTRAARGLPAG